MTTLRVYAEPTRLKPRREYRAEPHWWTVPERTYYVGTWDHDEQEWHTEGTGLKIGELFEKVRELFEWGWSDLSMLVEREDDFAASRASRRSREDLSRP